MNRRDQVKTQILGFKALLKAQRKKFALARRNLAMTERAIARTRAKKIPLTQRESDGLNDALKTSHEEVSKIMSSMVEMEDDLKALVALLSRLRA